MSSDHHSASETSQHDLAPGDEGEGGSGVGKGILGYVIGLVFATGLTVASFVVAGLSGVIYGPGVPIALIVLAIAQMGVHLAFFLHITTGPDNTNNVLALAFGVLIVGLVVGGSLFVMSNLNQNMMPSGMMMPAGEGGVIPAVSKMPVPPAAR